MEIIAKELGLDQNHPDVQRLFLAVYKNFIEVIFLSMMGITEKENALLMLEIVEQLLNFYIYIYIYVYSDVFSFVYFKVTRRC